MITKKIYFMIFAILLFAVSVHAAPIVSSSTAVISIDTDAATFHCSDPDSGIITGVIAPTRYGVSEAIITLAEGLTITDGATVNITGANALRIVATTGDININAVIDLTPTKLGTKGSPEQGLGTVGGWDGGDEDEDDAGGPGGGIFASEAGNGGAYGGMGGLEGRKKQANALPYGDQEMYVLLGGSGGGGADNTGGGGGGSAVALVAENGNISIGATGAIICDGGEIDAPEPDGGSKWLYGPGDPNSIYGPMDEFAFPTDPALAIPKVRGYYNLVSDFDEKGGGGGAGGGILLAASGTVTVDGTVSANGAKGADNTDDYDQEKNDGGGGGGGRIAIYSASGSSGGSGAITVTGGPKGAAMDPNGFYQTPFGQFYEACNSTEGQDGTIYQGVYPPPPTAKNGAPDYTTDVSIFASLTWESGASASQAVYVNGAEVFSSDQNLESAVTADIGGPLAGNTAYNWHVTTDGGDDYSTWTFTTAIGVSTDPSPGDLSVGPVTLLRSTEVLGAASYNVYYSTVYTDITGSIGGVNIAEPNLPVAGLSEGAQYWWRVDAVGLGSDVAPGTIWTFIPSATLSTNDLPVPISPIGDDVPIHVVDITWEDVADPNYDAFDVYVGTTLDGMSLVGTTYRSDPNFTSINFADLPAPSHLPLMTKHYCQIVARDTSLVLAPVSSFVWEWTTRDQICTTPIAGDINGDCKLNEEDLVIMIENWLNNNLWTGDE